MIESIRKIKLKLYRGYLKLIKYPLKGLYFRRIADLPDTDIIPKNKKYFLAIVAIIRGEDEYLVEWIEFHRMMGVEHFVLYDNGLHDQSKEILKSYIKSGIVTHIVFPDVPNTKHGVDANELSIQQLAYGDCIKRFRHHFHYLLRIDIDEFIFPVKHNTIVEVLNEYEPNTIKGIEINSTDFGNNNHVKKPKGLVTENYTLTSGHLNSFIVKSIGNTKYLSNIFKYTSAHYFSYRFSIIDTFKRILVGYPKIIKSEKANSLFQLNHYITKSKEEYLRKAKINEGGYMTGKETKERFFEINRSINKVENRKIFKYLPELKVKMKSL